MEMTPLKICVNIFFQSFEKLAAVSFFYVAWVWLGEIVQKIEITGLGTGFIA